MWPSASQTTIALVALMKLRGLGRRSALRIINRKLSPHCGRDELLERAEQENLSSGEVLDAWQRSEDELERDARAGVYAHSLYDQGYPERLKNIPDPPAVLYLKGEPKSLHTASSLAVVGTREPTSYGEKVARQSAATAAAAGFTIISGLAHGCDTLAHEGCLDAQGVGVAVLAHGLEKVYPAANRDLAERLLEFSGCLVSEYPVGTKPQRTAFAERDRIQSGLCDGVLVIETDVKGGTMHTVRFAQRQKRAIACIEHPSKWRHEDKTRGNQALIADRSAHAIPDGAALREFLVQIKLRARAVPRVSSPSEAGPQTSMDF